MRTKEGGLLNPVAFTRPLGAAFPPLAVDTRHVDAVEYGSRPNLVRAYIDAY